MSVVMAGKGAMSTGSGTSSVRKCESEWSERDEDGITNRLSGADQVQILNIVASRPNHLCECERDTLVEAEISQTTNAYRLSGIVTRETRRQRRYRRT
jgi:hypothetical protein